MKKVICALFSFAGVIVMAGDLNVDESNRNCLKQEFAKTKRLQYEHWNEVETAEKNVLQTTGDAGKRYELVESDWFSCIEENGKHFSLCEAMLTYQAFALKDLQKTPQYQEYVSAINKRDHHSIKMETLRQMSSRSKESMLSAINSIPTKYSEEARKQPSTYFLSDSYALDEIIEKVQEDLREFVEQNIK